MFLASCGYWGGNPELIMSAPAAMVLRAVDCAIKNPPAHIVMKAFIEYIDKASEGIRRGLR